MVTFELEHEQSFDPPGLPDAPPVSISAASAAAAGVKSPVAATFLPLSNSRPGAELDARSEVQPVERARRLRKAAGS
jgi:hypothetical protein